MSQSRTGSLLEGFANIAAGLGVTLVANVFILPYFMGVPLSLGTNLKLGAAYTVVSLARSYAIRRWFDGFKF